MSRHDCAAMHKATRRVGRCSRHLAIMVRNASGIKICPECVAAARAKIAIEQARRHGTGIKPGD